MPITVGRQWENPLPQGNVFQDILTGGANFINSYMGAEAAKKKEKADAQRADVNAIFPTLAAHGGLRTPNPGEKPDFMTGNAGWMAQTPAPPGKASSLPLPGYENVPGIYDYNDLNQMFKAQEAEAWRQGTPSNQMIMKESLNSIYSTGKSDEEKIKTAMALVQKMREGNNEAVKITTPKKARAKALLIEKGYTGTDEQINQFLAKNPNF